MKSEMMNGSASPIGKPLVDYPDDDEDEAMDSKTITSQAPLTPDSSKDGSSPEAKPTPEKTLQPSPDIKAAGESEVQAPPERLAEKRRRQDDDEDDELGKLSGGPKRRNSSTSSTSSLASQGSLRRKKGFLRSKQAGAESTATLPSNSNADTENHVEGRKPRKIAISLTNATNKAEQENKHTGNTKVQNKSPASSPASAAAKEPQQG